MLRSSLVHRATARAAAAPLRQKRHRGPARLLSMQGGSGRRLVPAAGESGSDSSRADHRLRLGPSGLPSAVIPGVICHPPSRWWWCADPLSPGPIGGRSPKARAMRVRGCPEPVPEINVPKPGSDHGFWDDRRDGRVSRIRASLDERSGSRYADRRPGGGRACEDVRRPGKWRPGRAPTRLVGRV